MAYLGKLFVVKDTENLEGFVKSLDVPKESADLFISESKNTTHKLEKNGDVYTSTTTFAGKTREVKYKAGEEFEEVLDSIGATTNVITIDGDKFKQVQKYKDGRTVTVLREYSANALVETFTSSFWNGTAKMYYVAK